MTEKHAAWIDITATDATVSRAFYAELFGWRLQLVEALDYALVEPEPGTLPGGIGSADGTRPAGITTYFSVPDVEAALARAAELGAKVASAPWTVPGLGTMAVVLDPDGNRIGLWAD
ncbi:VOC family protein [Kribbella speibonae]|uniref:VOC family protein n=1 Tax=Kribbella speibonae TaxID=1572660 RepID=A0A4V2M5N3_9ACTN|nr:VOC family protein [Kribbella speibonae]TCC40542.1 VOC family protein [Kribbella speibonae]